MTELNSREAIRQDYQQKLPAEIGHFLDLEKQSESPLAHGISSFKSALLLSAMIGSTATVVPLFECSNRLLGRAGSGPKYDGARPSPERAVLAQFDAAIARFTLRALLSERTDCEQLKKALDSLYTILSDQSPERAGESQYAAAYILQALAILCLYRYLSCDNGPEVNLPGIEVTLMSPWRSLQVPMLQILKSGSGEEGYRLSYCEIFNSSNYHLSLIGGMPILPAFLLSVVRSQGKVVKALDQLLCE